MTTRQALLGEMQRQATKVLGFVEELSSSNWEGLQKVLSVFVQALLVTIGQLLKMEEVAGDSQPISDGILKLAQEVWASQSAEIFPQFVDLALMGFTDSEWGAVQQIMEGGSVRLFFSQPEQDRPLHVFAVIVPDLEAIRALNPGAAESSSWPFMINHRRILIHTLMPDELRFGSFHGAVIVALKDECLEDVQLLVTQPSEAEEA